MTINDAKKILSDRVNIEIEAAALKQEIKSKEKQIKKLHIESLEKQADYEDLTNSNIKKFFFGLIGKKEERLQEAQNEAHRAKGELSSAEFELNSLKARLQEIEETIQEITGMCTACLNTISEEDGEEIKTQILAIIEVPRLSMEITDHLTEMKPLFTKSYDLYRVGEPTANCLDGTANNRSSVMRKHSKVIASGVDEMIQLLNTYNLYAPDEIKVEFHDKWMDKKDYWENQQMPEDSLDRIRKVEKWFYSFDNSWNVMRNQQKEAMQKLQEEVLAYLDE